MKKLLKLLTIMIIALQISSFSFSMTPGMRVALRALNQTRMIKRVPVRFNSTQPTRSEKVFTAGCGLVAGTVGGGLGWCVGNVIGGIGGGIGNMSKTNWERQIAVSHGEDVGEAIGGIGCGLIASYAIGGPIGVAGWAIPTTLIAISSALK